MGIANQLMYRRRSLMAQEKNSVLYEAWNLSFDGTNYIDTGVYLFTQENINRDFEFIAEGIYGVNKTNQETIICAKHNGNAYGFLVRPSNSTSTSFNGTIAIPSKTSSTLIVRRVNGAITLTGTNITNPKVKFTNAVFSWSLYLGCAIDDDGTRFRYAEGTIEHVVVRWL